MHYFCAFGMTQFAPHVYHEFFGENVLRLIKIHENETGVTGTLRESQNIFLIISYSFLRKRNFSKNVVKEVK